MTKEEKEFRKKIEKKFQAKKWKGEWQVAGPKGICLKVVKKADNLRITKIPEEKALICRI